MVLHINTYCNEIPITLQDQETVTGICASLIGYAGVPQSSIARIYDEISVYLLKIGRN